MWLEGNGEICGWNQSNRLINVHAHKRPSFYKQFMWWLYIKFTDKPNSHNKILYYSQQRCGCYIFCTARTTKLNLYIPTNLVTEQQINLCYRLLVFRSRISLKTKDVNGTLAQ